jgi:hypothetical protein
VQDRAEQLTGARSWQRCGRICMEAACPPARLVSVIGRTQPTTRHCPVSVSVFHPRTEPSLAKTDFRTLRLRNLGLSISKLWRLSFHLPTTNAVLFEPEPQILRVLCAERGKQETGQRRRQRS